MPRIRRHGSFWQSKIKHKKKKIRTESSQRNRSSLIKLLHNSAGHYAPMDLYVFTLCLSLNGTLWLHVIRTCRSHRRVLFILPNDWNAISIFTSRFSGHRFFTTHRKLSIAILNFCLASKLEQTTLNIETSKPPYFGVTNQKLSFSSVQPFEQIDFSRWGPQRVAIESVRASCRRKSK